MAHTTPMPRKTVKKVRRSGKSKPKTGAREAARLREEADPFRQIDGAETMYFDKA